MDRNLKICFLSEAAYYFLTNKDIDNSIGGAELQMTTLAREFVKMSYDVSFVTFQKSRSSYEKINGIKIYNPFYSRARGFTYLNPINIYKLYKILNKINADVYIQRATSPLTGTIAFFKMIKNKIFLFSVSSDEDVSTNLIIKYLADLKKLIYRFGVKNCDCIICQTKQQKKLLYQTIGKEGKIIKNMYLPNEEEYNQDYTQTKRILWVGRIIKEKRPDIFLELAKIFPNFNFTLIGSLQTLSKINSEYYYKIKEKTKEINNLNFIGFVPHKEINRYYAESAILINTSIVEGFPNTYLEAWGNSKPVVTLNFDPDEIICKNKLGFHSKTFEQMIKDIKILLKNDKLRNEMGINCKKYIKKEHDLMKIVKKYEDLIKSMIRGEI